MVEPQYVAWADQFGALLREKCRALLAAEAATGLDSIATYFRENDETYTLAFTEGAFYLTVDDGETIPVDPLKLGV